MARARACTRPRSRFSKFDASMTIDVLSIGAFPEATNAELANRFAITRHFHRPAPDALNAELKRRIRAIATEANRGADRALIVALPKLEVIAIFGVGTDFVDLAAARERNVRVTNTPDILTDEVADLAIGLMLASARQILFADRYVRDGTWASKGPIPLGRSVGGKTMGVLGLGGIGRAIADRGAALRMRVIYSGPRRKPDAPYDYVADPVELARDSVVDERALIKALAEGRLGYAALDVFESEPNPSPELLKLPNVIVQPHQGSATVETRTAIGRLMIDNLNAHFAGRPLLTPVR